MSTEQIALLIVALAWLLGALAWVLAANEITLNASLSYEDSEMDDPVSLELEDILKTVTTKRITRAKQNVGTSEEAINLGDVSSPGYALLINRDTTNFINLKVATGGAIFARLDRSNGFALLKLGSGAQVPYAIADTAACQMDVFIIST